MYKYWFIFLFEIIVSTSNDYKLVKKETIIGKVIAITDGDTFKLLTVDSNQIKVRLANIDSPEKKQPFSNKAKEFVSNAIFNKIVTVHVLSKDRYRRYIANVIYDDDLNLSHQLIKNGLAWHYKKYSKDTILQNLEDKAKLNKIGLWQNSKAIAPWQWRYNKRNKIRQ